MTIFLYLITLFLLTKLIFQFDASDLGIYVELMDALHSQKLP